MPETITTLCAPAARTPGRFSRLIPPMQNTGKRNEALCRRDLVQSHRRVIRFGRGGEKRAEADVVGSFPLGVESLCQAVGGLADDRMLARQRAGFCNAHVVLPDVRPVRAGLPHEFRMIIQDKGNLMCATELCQVACQRADVLRTPALGSQLQQLDASHEHLLCNGQCIFLGDVTEIEYAIEPCFLKSTVLPAGSHEGIIAACRHRPLRHPREPGSIGTASLQVRQAAISIKASDTHPLSGVSRVRA